MAIEKLSYPLLYFQLAENAVLGMLLGTDHQVVEEDLRRVKKSLSDYLNKQYKKTAEFPENDLFDAQLRIFRVRITPTYRVSGKAFQLPGTLEVPVAAVTGQNYSGQMECVFPLLDEGFLFYNEQDLGGLARSFATNLLHAYPPEMLIQMARAPLPGLDQIELRVNMDRRPAWKPFFGEQRHEYLDRLTESFPPSRGRRSKNTLPEAAWEMEPYIAEVMDKLLLQRANVLIVGLPGVGKSAVLKQALRKIHAQSKASPRPRTFRRIIAQRITASTKYLGEWQELVEGLIQELKWTNGVLWVESIMELLSTGGQGPEDSVAAFLQSYLQQGDLQIIGELTPNQLDRLRTLLPGFGELFQVVHIPEMEDKTVWSVLEKFAAYTQQNQDIVIPGESQQLAYRLLHRYYPYEQFPGKGIKFLGQCINDARLDERRQVDKEAILRQFTQQTGLPEVFLRDDILLDQGELQRYFSSRIIGQPEAVEKLCSIVKIYKAGLNNPHKPITTLLFAGPTGVGKTASAKALADYFFGKGQRKSPLVRIDMSEFQIPGQLSRLIGDRYEVGHLVREIRERPFAVLLLDEVEKADASIYDALLTVLDEGVLVDAFGRETDFRNTIIILTTNLGANSAQSIGFGNTTTSEQTIIAAIEKHFRPEFVNRLDHTVLFNALDKDDIRKIARKELEELEKREGIARGRLRLKYTGQLVDYLAGVGFDERYGARPLQRALEDHIVHPLSRWLLKNPSKQPRTLELDFSEGALVVKTLNDPEGKLI